MKIPTATVEESRKLDRSAIEDFGIPSLVLMEHASLGATKRARALLDTRPVSEPPRAAVLVGPGNNGGDGLAVARHLALLGVHVQVERITNEFSTADARVQHEAVQELARVGLFDAAKPPEPPHLIVDALFGTGLTRGLEGRAVDAVEWATRSGLPILSLDAPSGLDADRGEPLGPTIEATETVTFGTVKHGLLMPSGRRWVGNLFLAPIGLPKTLLPDEAPTFPPDALPVPHASWRES